MWQNRIRYRFERFIEKGGSSVFLALAILLAADIFALLMLRLVLQLFIPETELPHEDVLTHVYHLFLEVSDPGTMANFLDAPFWIKITAILAGLSGIVIFSLLVGLITTALDQMFQEFSKGKSAVLEENHFIILGWNARIIDVLNEFAVAAQHDKAVVTVMAEKDKSEMDFEIGNRLVDRNKLKVVTRSGKTDSPTMLKRLNIEKAFSAIVLSDCESYASDEEKNDSDTHVIKTCFAISICRPEADKFPVIPEIFFDENREIIKNLFGEKMVSLDIDRILSKLLVQTSMFNGLVSVYEELFSFRDNETYIIPNTLGHIPFGEISFHLTDGIAIGLKTRENGFLLNPSQDLVLEHADKIIVIANDMASIKPQKQVLYPTKNNFVPGGKTRGTLPESVLILGWSNKTAEIIEEFYGYVDENPKARIDLAVHYDIAEAKETIDTINATHNTTFSYKHTNLLSEASLIALDVFSYDLVMILSISDKEPDNDKIDSDTIKMLLLLRKIRQALPANQKRNIVVSEVLDTENLELFTHIGLSDFIVSNRLISMFLTQLSKEPDLLAVYEILLSEHGAEIIFKPAINYVPAVDQDYTFADILYAAGKQNDIAIGVKKIADNNIDFEIAINPEKTKVFHLDDNDMIIVISDYQG